MQYDTNSEAFWHRSTSFNTRTAARHRTAYRRQNQPPKASISTKVVYYLPTPIAKDIKMIEIIHDIPASICGFLATGEVSAQDYEQVLIPEIEARLKQTDKIRILYHLAPTFTGFTGGAIWDDAKLGLSHLRSWDKIAIVTDEDWLTSAIGFFKFAIPCPIKVFSNTQYEAAIVWVGA